MTERLKLLGLSGLNLALWGFYLLVGMHDLNNESTTNPCVFTSSTHTFSEVLIFCFVVFDVAIYLLRLCLDLLLTGNLFPFHLLKQSLCLKKYSISCFIFLSHLFFFTYTYLFTLDKNSDKSVDMILHRCSRLIEHLHWFQYALISFLLLGYLICFGNLSEILGWAFWVEWRWLLHEDYF